MLNYFQNCFPIHIIVKRWAGGGCRGSGSRQDFFGLGHHGRGQPHLSSVTNVAIVAMIGEVSTQAINIIIAIVD